MHWVLATVLNLTCGNLSRSANDITTARQHGSGAAMPQRAVKSASNRARQSDDTTKVTESWAYRPGTHTYSRAVNPYWPPDPQTELGRSFGRPNVSVGVNMWCAREPQVRCVQSLPLGSDVHVAYAMAGDWRLAKGGMPICQEQPFSMVGRHQCCECLQQHKPFSTIAKHCCSECLGEEAPNSDLLLHNKGHFSICCFYQERVHLAGAAGSPCH